MVNYQKKAEVLQVKRLLERIDLFKFDHGKTGVIPLAHTVLEDFNLSDGSIDATLLELPERASAWMAEEMKANKDTDAYQRFTAQAVMWKNTWELIEFLNELRWDTSAEIRQALEDAE